jgi:D-alanyl-D-alanine carboxypeptidase/D-alanyl-D-alanine-endopeptidase (penicillin-binding protein 4)
MRDRVVLAVATWQLVCASAGAQVAPLASSPVRPRAAARLQSSAIDTIGSGPTLDTLKAGILASINVPGVQRGTWGIVVQSLDRNERLFELNPHTLLVPASVAKLASVASAVEAVGWDYRFDTTLRTNGNIDNGTLRGDLFIVGSGDPSTGGRGGDDVDGWIDALKSAGVRRIEGRIIGDDDALEEPRPSLAWAWDDLGYPTGSLFGALNYGENKTLVRIEPGDTAGQPTALTLDAASQGRPLVNRTVTGPKGSAVLVWPEQRPGETALTIAGSVPAGAGPARLMVSAGNPTLWFATVFTNRLRLAGIEVAGDAADIDEVQVAGPVTTLFAFRSRPLSEIVPPLLKESINLYGEALMRLNAAPGSLPTNDAALAGFRTRAAAWGIAPDAEQLIDGSGLSRRDVITADALIVILRRMYDRSNTSPWMRALPIAGVDGSLENRMKGTAAERNVRAKTGTMSNIRSLAGYVTTADGEHLAFAIMVNDFEGTGPAAVQAIDAIAVRLATFRR